MIPWKLYLEWIGIGSLVLAIVVGVAYFSSPQESPQSTVEALPAPELKKVPKVDISVDTIKVFDFTAKTKLKLPASVVNSKSKHVVASSKVKPSERPHTITTVIDTNTGDFTTYERADPIPWVSRNTTTHVGAYYGLKDGDQIIRVQLTQELLQLKRLHLEAVASTDFGAGKTDTFIGIGGRLSF